MIPSKEDWHRVLEARHGAELQKRLDRASVAVCGLGGLGSNIAVALARAGVGRLILIDFDRVDITNLHRQQYKITQLGRYKTEALSESLAGIAPYTVLQTHTVRIDESNAAELLKDADIVCEAFDDAGCKAMLTDIVLDRMPEKYLVAASGMAGLGSPNAIRTRRITDRFYLSGDGVSDAADGIGLVSARVMLCAAHQAQTVIRIIAEQFDI